MSCRLFAFLLMFTGYASSQFSGHFSPAGRTFPAGDPSRPPVVTFKLANTSGKALRIADDERNQGACTGFWIEVSEIPPPAKQRPRGIVGSCPGHPPTIVLQPGESHTERINLRLLDRENALDRPGRYRVKVVRTVYYSDPGGAPQPLFRDADHQTFVGTFVFVMTPRRP